MISISPEGCNELRNLLILVNYVETRDHTNKRGKIELPAGRKARRLLNFI